MGKGESAGLGRERSPRGCGCFLWRLLLVCVAGPIILALTSDLGASFWTSAATLGVWMLGAMLLGKIAVSRWSRARARGNRTRMVRARLDSIDRMGGEEFERYMRQILRGLGFSKVVDTAATADYGADLVALKDGKRYIFQCKRYEGNVGVKAVQEIHTAKAYYGSDCEVVATNSYFTQNARTLAKESGVQLWDRDTLAGIIRRLRRGGNQSGD